MVNEFEIKNCSSPKASGLWAYVHKPRVKKLPKRWSRKKRKAMRIKCERAAVYFTKYFMVIDPGFL